MHESVPSDQQTHLIRDEKESLIKLDLSCQTQDILKIFNRITNWPAGFFHLTEEEQKEAGVYLGFHRHD